MNAYRSKRLQASYDMLVNVALRNYPIEEFEDSIDDQFMGYGTASDEKIYGLEGFRFLVERQRKEVEGLKTEIKQDPVKLETYADNQVALVVEELEILMNIDGEINNLTFRLSSLFEWVEKRWMLRHFHGSTADADTPDGHAWPIEEWERRNIELERQVAEKTADLQEKNCELEMEAALERIRAQVTAMQESADLLDIVVTMHAEFTALGHEAHYFWHMRWQPDTYEKAMTSGDGSRIGMVMTLPRYIHGNIEPVAEWEKSNDTTYVLAMDVEQAVDYVDKMITMGDFEQVDPQAPTLDDIRQIGGLTFIMARTTHGEIGYSLPGVVPEPPEEAVENLVRFAGVFDLAYKRFEDLKAAERRQREAQIELALERVRARTMAMQHSDELMESSELMFEQIKNLGIELWSCGFSLWYDDDSYFLGYNPGPDGKMGEPLKIPLTEDDFFITIREAKRRGDEFLVFESEGDSLKETYRYMDTLPVVGETMRGFVEAGYPLPTYQVTHCGFFSNGHLMFITQEQNPEAVQIFKRFTKVFNQTYTRFLDLKKAEEQARESQIELSLERIRAQVTSMQESSDLFDIVVKMRSEFVDLGHEADYFWHMRWLPEVYKMSMTSEDGNRIGMVINVPKFVHDEIPELAKWEKGDEPIFVLALNAEDAWGYIENMNTHGHYEKADPHAPTQDDIQQIGGLTFVIARTTHGEIGYSLPGVVPNPPKEAMEMLVRFASVFDLAYKRYEDLKAAETRQREAQIELALERVRARTMAMQHSDELAEASYILDQQVRSLGINTWGCAFHIYGENSDEDYEWFCSEHGILPFYKTPRKDFFKRFYEIGQGGTDLHVEEFSGEECKKHYEFLMKIPVLGDSLKQVIESGAALPEHQIDHVAYFSQGHLLFITYEPVPEAHDIFVRFAKVFDQTYTRFLDLQKAEAQAREAKIETALEKVRSRTMGMQSSDELPEVANLLFLEIQALGIPAWSCGYCILLEDRKSSTCIMSSEGTLQKPFMLPHHGEISFEEWDDFVQGEQTFFIQELGGKAIESHYDFMKSLPQLTPIFREIEEAGLSLPTYQINHLCKFAHGFLLFITYEPVPKSHEIFKRFTKVFDQTYTRFLDLQKAEAQAREAQIENALEKVRSRSLAMQKSEELADVAFVLFEQLRELGGNLWGTGFGLCEKDSDSDKDSFWFANENGVFPPVSIPNTTDPAHKKMYEGWKNEMEFLALEGSGEDLKRHYEYMMTLPEVRPFFQKILDEGLSFPEWQQWNAAYFTHGYLLIITLDPYPNPDILKRFARVFDQTYTRFLDLQKAEEQAREAQIEASLEKVRARALAMQKPDELVEVAQLLRTEMGILGLEELETSSIYIHDESSDKTICWYSIKDPEDEHKLVSDQMTIDLQETWVGQQMYKFYRSSEKKTSIVMKGGNRTEWIRYCEEHSPLFQSSTFYGDTIPERTYHLHKFSNGYIGAASPGKISTKSWELLKRVTDAFSFAYTRFTDLQKAEERAREALKQSTLDRVRAQITSMRSANDLEQIIPLFWRELENLGVSFIRCGVFIMDEEEEQIDTFLSTPDGQAITSFKLPYEGISLAENTLKFWRQDEIYRKEWSEENFIEWTQNLIDRGFIESKENYSAGSPPKHLSLHFIPFEQGSLYIGNTEALSEEDLELAQTLADTFSTAYARYEDFIKLEEAKKKIEEAYGELEAAKDQLVQQEKLASLGQLTAGIAHEIKNPLNFVNNFSELSVELVGEARNEVKRETADDKCKKSPFEGGAGAKAEVGDDTGDDCSLILEILDDIEMNLKTIHKHGSRADSIVKSMLQHSRGGNGKIEPEDLNTLTKEYINLVFHGMRAGKNPMNVDIQLELEEGIGKVPLIAEDFSRVIVNLCNNAFDAMKEKQNTGSEMQDAGGYKPKLTVRTHQNDQTVTIEIEDNGPGIPKEIRNKILQPFFTTKRGTEGTGLGLSISNDIIKAHGGSIEIESTKGEGSTISLHLPHLIKQPS
jgi:signal transduction histidine kinase